MTRLHLVLTLACVTGAAATSGPTSAEKSPSPIVPAADIAQGEKALGSAHADQVAWLAKYGTFNVRQGYWNLLPNPHGC